MDGLDTEIRPTTAAVDTRYTRRARYWSPANIFTVKRPAVPARVFAAERDRALDAGGPSEWIALDIGAEMGFDVPATTPLMLARYARIRAGERLAGRFRASGEMYYAIAGSGAAEKDGERLEWAAGDVFTLPGGGKSVLEAGPEGAVVLQATNEPEVAFHGLDVPAPADCPLEAAHFPAAEIAHQMALVRDAQKADPNASGMAMHFTTEKMEREKNLLPSIALAMNALDAHSVQRPHRHNSVALTLPIRCAGVHSVIDGARVDWQQHALMITPPAALHSHVNEGDEAMLSLVIQDGGLYYHCRTIGFGFG